jgi:hypothetical protein
MLRIANEPKDAIERLSRHDPTLDRIYLFNKQHTDAEVAELADCLLAHPDVVTHVLLYGNRLTDETGVKLARYVAASSTIEWLDLSSNQLGQATCLAIAAALQVNTSLRWLSLFCKQSVDESRIEAALVSALRLNPVRPADSRWYLYSYWSEFERLKAAAEQQGHPSLQLLLCAQLDHFTF